VNCLAFNLGRRAGGKGAFYFCQWCWRLKEGRGIEDRSTRQPQLDTAATGVRKADDWLLASLLSVFLQSGGIFVEKADYLLVSKYQALCLILMEFSLCKRSTR
jgi:hypothetical protein